MKITQYIPYYKRNISLALPVVLSQVGQITVHLVDNMMVGHVGTPELAAASFANNVFMVGMYFGMGITYGITPLIGNAYSNGEMKKVAGLLKNGFLTHGLASVVMTLIMFITYLLLPVMGQLPEVLQLARPYYLLLCFSYIPFILFFSFKQVLEGIGNTRMAMKITLTANVLNIVANYVLIFGKFGFPQMGLDGAGAGTLLARMSMPLLFALLIVKSPRFKKLFVMARKERFYFYKVKSILKIGIPIGFQIIVEVLAFGAGAIMMGWLGDTELAAHQVALGLASFTYMIALGISQANTIRVSHQMGIGDFKALKMAAGASTQLVLLFMMIMGILFVMLRFSLPLLFTEDSAVIQIASGLLVIAALFQLFDGLQVIMLSTLRGMADVKLPMYMAFFAYMLVGVPCGYFLAFELNAGPRGIWFGYLLGLAVAGILFFFRFRSILRKKT